ncbi:MAG: divalent-cation tolerance protein CutA [Acidobacteriota bacterium]
MSEEIVILVTAPNRDEAARIAESLVAERLAACVNIVSQIESIYRWEGKVTRDSESLLIIKSTEDRYGELERRVRELHTYTVPEVIAIKIERGSKDYLRWIHEETRFHEETRRGKKGHEEERRGTNENE